jgi:hypothetical protein
MKRTILLVSLCCAVALVSVQIYGVQETFFDAIRTLRQKLRALRLRRGTTSEMIEGAAPQGGTALT